MKWNAYKTYTHIMWASKYNWWIEWDDGTGT